MRSGSPRRHHPSAVTLLMLVGLSLALLTLVRAPSVSFARSAHPNGVPRGIGVSNGYIGDRVVTVDDVEEPAISKLDPQLRTALRRATEDAATRGVPIRVNSGWRSRSYQGLLFAKAVARYGGVRRAREWVNTPGQSTHVTGHAVDIGPAKAAAWLSKHGVTYGLCQVYANESWHFELLTDAGGSCPPFHSHVH